jgi:predicted small secreted protein
VVLVGCNTMAGLGRDIEKGGDKLEDSANRANNNKQ